MLNLRAYPGWHGCQTGCVFFLCTKSNCRHYHTYSTSLCVHPYLLGRCRGGGKVTVICSCQESGAGGLGGIWKIVRELGEQDPLWMENWVLFLFCFNGGGDGVELNMVSVVYTLRGSGWQDAMREGLGHVLSSVLPDVAVRVMELEVLSSSQSRPAGRVSFVHVPCGGLRRLTTHQRLPLLCANRPWFCLAIRSLFLGKVDSSQ